MGRLVEQDGTRTMTNLSFIKGWPPTSNCRSKWLADYVITYKQTNLWNILNTRSWPVSVGHLTITTADKPKVDRRGRLYDFSWDFKNWCSVCTNLQRIRNCTFGLSSRSKSLGVSLKLCYNLRYGPSTSFNYAQNSDKQPCELAQSAL